MSRLANFSVITDEQVRSALSMREAVGLMREAFVAISGGGAVVPVRTAIDIPHRDARALFMPVYVPALSCVGVKVVTVYPRNGETAGIPNIHGRILLLDAENGIPFCLMDAEELTALRTGAASGVATDWLAAKDAKVLAVFGTGVQARSQVEGVCAVRAIKKVLVYGRTAGASEDFAAALRKEFGLSAKAGGKSELSEADIICTATNSRTPVLEADIIKKGCHVNAIGSFRPDMQELPEALVMKAELFVDQRAAALSEAGDIMIPLLKGMIGHDHIKAELGELTDGQGRIGPDAITIFKSVGNAVQDIYAARYVYDKLDLL